MSEIIGVKLQVDGEGSLKTVGNLRQQLKASLVDLQNIQAEFGDISPEAQKAAKAVAGLRDSIKDANEVASLFDPEKKFQAVVGVAQGIASGFAAAQGAMALFGVESKEVEATLLKVQATMALAQGLSGINAAVEDFKRLGAVLANIGIVQKANALANTLAAATMRAFGVATTQTGIAFNVLKGAIISTGIGALVVAVGILVNKMMDLVSSTDEATEAQKRLREEAAKTANEFADEIAGIYDEQAKLQIARAKAAGKSEEEIAQIQRDANEAATKERRRNYLQQLGDGLDATEAQKKLKQQETENELFELGIQQKARADAKTAADKAAADSKSAQEKAAAESKKLAEEKAADQQKLGELFTANIQKQDQEELDSIERKKEQDADYTAYQHKVLNEQIKARQEQADADLKLTQVTKDQKIEAAQAVAGALNGFAALAGEQTAAGKAFAVASATIQTILGAQQAFTAMSAIPIVGPALGVVAAAGAIAAGIANVKKILAVQVPGQSGGSAGSVPSIATSTAPNAPQRTATPTTRIDQQSINSIGSAMPMRAYVVESDISNSQDRMNRIRNAATFK